MSRRLLAVCAALILVMVGVSAATPTTPTAQTAADPCAFNEEMAAWLTHNTPSSSRQRNLDTDLQAFVADVEAYCQGQTSTSTTAPTTTTVPSSTTLTEPTTTVPTTTSTTTPPTGSQFPNPDNTGLPAGWTPTEVRTTTLRVQTPGAVIEDIRFDNADLEIAAPNVTVRRVQMRGGVICNASTDNECGGVPDGAGNGLLVEDSELGPPPGQQQDSRDHWRIGPGGYTLRNVELSRVSDGLRVGYTSGGMGPVRVEDIFISVRPPVPCGDWHGDGIQGYDGPALTVVHSTIDMDTSSGCGGTAPFFYPANQGNTSADVDGLLIAGPNGNYSFRDGMPGTITGLHIEDHSWSFGPIDVRCSVITSWQADIVTAVDRSNSGYQTPAVVRVQPCTTEGGT